MLQYVHLRFSEECDISKTASKSPISTVMLSTSLIGLCQGLQCTRSARQHCDFPLPLYRTYVLNKQAGTQECGCITHRDPHTPAPTHRHTPTHTHTHRHTPTHTHTETGGFKLSNTFLFMGNSDTVCTCALQRFSRKNNNILCPGTA